MMHVKNHITVLCVFVLLVGGCALTDTRKKDEAHFETTIYPNNTKQFTFILASKGEGSRPRKGAQGDGYGGRGKGEGYSKGMGKSGRPSEQEEEIGIEIDKLGVGRLQKVVYLKLAQALKEKPFFHSGFVEIDNYFLEGYGYIKGQCKDKATPEDWRQFPNTKSFASQALPRSGSAHLSGDLESIPIYP